MSEVRGQRSEVRGQRSEVRAIVMYRSRGSVEGHQQCGYAHRWSYGTHWPTAAVFPPISICGATLLIPVPAEKDAIIHFLYRRLYLSVSFIPRLLIR